MENEMKPIPEDAVVAMAYVPWQRLQEVYDPEVGLHYGTIFPELHKPFLAGGRCHG